MFSLTEPTELYCPLKSQTDDVLLSHCSPAVVRGVVGVFSEAFGPTEVLQVGEEDEKTCLRCVRCLHRNKTVMNMFL